MSPWIAAAAAVVAMMSVLWAVSLVLRDVSIVDAFWGPGFAVIAWTAVATSAGAASPRAILLASLVSVWAVRLGAYLAWRNHGKPEDWRYREMRERHGPSWWWKSAFIVFGLQGALMYAVALPVTAGLGGGAASAGAWSVASAEGWGVLDVVGVALWLLGFGFESVGDLQLARFRADPKNAGQVMDRGLWSWTRHPNYFGDFSVWWGHGALALALGAPLWTLVGPAIMSTLLLRVSGVTLLEAGLSKRKPGYEAYVARTSAFFPRPPRSPG